jgi:hypothetical protein
MFELLVVTSNVTCVLKTSNVVHSLSPNNPEDNSEHHTRRRENLKSHISLMFAG